MRILIADRHPVPRLGLTSLVKAVAAGADVIDFDTVYDALDAAGQAPVDMLLCGSSTGASLGPDWIQTCVAAIRPGKMVVMAAKVDRIACGRAQQSGAWGHLPMTASAELMGAAIRLILAGGTFFPALNPMVLREDGLAATSSAVNALSRRQLEVLAEIEQGRSNKEIAARLGIAVPTVKLHVQSVLRTLGARNRTDAVRLAREHNLDA